MDGRKKKIILLSVTIAACLLTLATAIVEECLKGAVYDGNMPFVPKLLFGTAERLTLTATAVCLMLTFGYTTALKPSIGRGLLPVLAGLAVACANFPFSCLAGGTLTITADGSGMALFVLYCVSVGLFEETAFRGFVFPLILEKTAHKKQGVTIAVIASSGLFALTHLLNLFQGAGIGATLLQVGYTFLIGCMCNVILIATRSLLFPVLIHAAFDVGGTITALGAASGSQWDALSITIMAIVGSLAGVYLVWHFFRRSADALLLLPAQT